MDAWEGREADADHLLARVLFELFRCPRFGLCICSDIEFLRGSIGENNLGDVRFPIFFCISLFFLVYIFPKLLIKVPGHLPILFG